MSETLTGLEIAHAAKDKTLDWISRDADSIRLGDNTYVYLSAHLDFDYHQFMLYTVCDKQDGWKDKPTETFVSYLLVHYGPYSKMDVEWVDTDGPLKFFDAWTTVGMDPYLKLIGWAEQLLEVQP